jgi:hypothetical protein
MARSTYSAPITIRCKAWTPEEYVRARTVYTGGDRQWINAHSMSTEIDQSAKDGMRIMVDTSISMHATIAKMTLDWYLLKDKYDRFGNVIYDADGKPDQEPLPLPSDPEDRLAVIVTLHEEDIQHIFNAITEKTPPPMSKKEQETFLPSANGHTSENLEQANLSPMKS